MAQLWKHSFVSRKHLFTGPNRFSLLARTSSELLLRNATLSLRQDNAGSIELGGTIKRNVGYSECNLPLCPHLSAPPSRVKETTFGSLNDPVHPILVTETMFDGVQ